VRLSHKFKKIFSFELLESFWEHASRSLHPVNVERVRATIDQAEFAKLRAHYPFRPQRINRFEDADYWIGINVERAQDLWLDRAPPLRILDLGCGAGYFLFVCRFFGHEGLGLDTDNEPLFRATIALLNVTRAISKIKPGIPLPDLGRRFDLVTAHRVCFHRLGRTENDDWKEWTPDN
jgi:SAM-dependent methyltransferase